MLSLSFQEDHSVRYETLPIVTIGDPRLEQIARNVSQGDAGLTREIGQMHATLDEFRRNHGYGRAIAAPQVGIGKRLIAMNLGAGQLAVLNPEITWRSDDLFEVWDDCLSIPDRIVRVRRHQSISIRYWDEEWRERTCERLPMDLSELVQHEMDHLDGILILARAWGEDAIRPIQDHAKLIAASRTKNSVSLAQFQRSGESVDLT